MNTMTAYVPTKPEHCAGNSPSPEPPDWRSIDVRTPECPSLLPQCDNQRAANWFVGQRFAELFLKGPFGRVLEAEARI